MPPPAGRRVLQIHHPDSPPTVVHVLDMDGTSLNWVVLDLEALEVRAPGRPGAAMLGPE